MHIGSQIRSAKPFGAAVARVAELVRSLRTEDGIHLRSLDAGGGLGIEYSLEEHSDPNKAVKTYADAIKAGLGDLDVELLLEPGRFLIAQAGALITRVLYVKQNGAKTFVITDAGMNDLIRPTLYQAHHEIVPVRRREDLPAMTADIVGPVCETGDFFARDRIMAEVKPGDLLAVLDTGAYGMSLSSNYNSRGRAAELLITGKKVKQIRRREDHPRSNRARTIGCHSFQSKSPASRGALNSASVGLLADRVGRSERIRFRGARIRRGLGIHHRSGWLWILRRSEAKADQSP